MSEGRRILVIGAGPIGLRMAIESAFLGEIFKLCCFKMFILRYISSLILQYFIMLSFVADQSASSPPVTMIVK